MNSVLQKRRGFFLFLFFLSTLVLFSGCEYTKKKRLFIAYVSSNEGVIARKRGLTTYYTITLKHPSSESFVFAADPLDDMTSLYTDQFPSFWKDQKNGFQRGAPRCALVLKKSPKHQYPFLFTVQDPVYSKAQDELTFDAHTSADLTQYFTDRIEGGITMIIEADRE